MGRIHRTYLPGNRIYACSNCRAHLTNYDDIVSKSFQVSCIGDKAQCGKDEFFKRGVQGRTGRAYLFNSVVNVTLGPTEERILNTGLHKVQESVFRE